MRYVTPFTGLNYLEIIPFTSAHANAYFVGDTPPPLFEQDLTPILGVRFVRVGE